MIRAISVFLVALLCSFNAVSFTEDASEHSYYSDKRQSLAQWVQYNNKNLSNEKSIKIIDAVYFYSEQSNLDPLLIMSMIKAESTYRPEAASRYGARGLMQIVPRWHRDKLMGRNPLVINVNIEVGTKIINDCLSKSRDNIYSGLRCYSGGAGKQYQSKISKTYRELSEQLRALRILNDVRAERTLAFHKPRLRTTITPNKSSDDILLAFVSNKL